MCHLQGVYTSFPMPMYIMSLYKSRERFNEKEVNKHVTTLAHWNSVDNTWRLSIAIGNLGIGKIRFKKKSNNA